MQFVLYGADSFRSRKKLAALRDRFIATRDATGMNVATFVRGRHDADEACQAIVASPFLAERKMVVLEGYCGAGASEQERIVAVLARRPETTIVIAYESGAGEDLAKSALFAALRGEQYSEECGALSPVSAERFVMDEVASEGAQMDARAARLLVTMVGTDSWALHQEGSKLAAYALARAARGGRAAGSAAGDGRAGSARAARSAAGDGRAGAAKDPALTTGAPIVSESDVAAMVSDGREAEIFAFLDACAEGRSAAASVMLQKLLSGGASELQIVSLLQRHYRAAAAAADMLARGATGGGADAATLAAQLGMHPFPAGKALAFARRHGGGGGRSATTGAGSGALAGAGGSAGGARAGAGSAGGVRSSASGSAPAAMQKAWDTLIAMEQAAKSGGPRVQATLAVFVAEAGR